MQWWHQRLEDKIDKFTEKEEEKANKWYGEIDKFLVISQGKLNDLTLNDEILKDKADKVEEPK